MGDDAGQRQDDGNAAGGFKGFGFKKVKMLSPVCAVSSMPH